jgi:hypothetical protein
MTRMTRLASSALAVSLAILPAAAFAQQTTAPVQATAPDGQMAKGPAVAPEAQAAKTPATTADTQAAKTPAGGGVHANAAPAIDTKAPAHGVKTETHGKEAVGVKETTPAHAKLGTTTHAAPVKTAEPGKS